MFKRGDPFLRSVEREVNTKIICQQSLNELEEEYAGGGDDFYKKIVVACAMMKLYPSKVRGYLISYDALSYLGFNEDSLYILDKADRLFGSDMGVAARKLDRLIKTNRFSEIYDLINSRLDIFISHSKKDNRFFNNLKKFAEITKDKTLLGLLALPSSPVEDLDSSFFKVFDFSEQNKLLDVLIGKRRWKDCEYAIWEFYRMGNRTYEFFVKSVEELPYENFFTPRVMFFRMDAFKNHPGVIYFFEKSFQSVFNRCEISYAVDIFRNAVLHIGFTDALIHAGARLAALGGDVGVDNEAFWAEKIKRIPATIICMTRAHQVAGWRGEKERARAIRYFAEKNGIHLPLEKESCENRRGRVAVCVSGQLRGSWRDFIENTNSISKKIDADVFVDIWNESVLAPPRFAQLNRYLGELVNELPVEYRSAHEFSKKFPKVFKRITERVSRKIDAKYFSESIDNSHINLHSAFEFEEQCVEKFPGLRLKAGFNQAKMYFLLDQVFRSMSNHEVRVRDRYDVVIRCRPDMEIDLPSMDKFIEAVRDQRNLIYVTYLTPMGFGDQFAIGSREAMEVYSGVWRKLVESGIFRYEEYFESSVEVNAAEELLAAHLVSNGIDVRVLRPRKSIFSAPVILSEVDISNELKEDLECIGDPKLELFYDAYQKFYSERIL